MDKKDKASCKKVLGQTICKLGAAVLVPRDPIQVKVFKPRECKWCMKEINSFKREAKKTGGMIKERVINIEDESMFSMDLLSGFPVADFGNGIIVKGKLSRLTKEDLIQKGIESVQRGEFLRSLQ